MQLWEQNNTMFLEVIGEKATLVHEEHRPLELTRGIFDAPPINREILSSPSQLTK
jgi:hypothetical protein